MLAGVKRQPEVGLPRQTARLGQLGSARLDLPVELGQVRMGHVRGQVRGHAIHADACRDQVAEDVA